MGFLSSLFNRGHHFRDHIYAYRRMKLQALVGAANEALLEGVYPLIVCHFNAHLDEAIDLFKSMKLSHEVLNYLDSTSLNAADRRVAKREIGIVHSKHFPKPMGGVARQTQASPIRILLFEHHPTLKPDEKVLGADSWIPAPVTYHCYTSLEDIFLAPFGAERCRGLGLFAMNHDEDDLNAGSKLLESSMRNVPKQLEKRLQGPLVAADSPEEWMARNHLL